MSGQWCSTLERNLQGQCPPATASRSQLTSADKPICLLNLDLPPDFHESLRRNVKQFYRPYRIAEHQREQTQAGAHQPPAPFGADHRVPRTEINRIFEVDWTPAISRLP